MFYTELHRFDEHDRTVLVGDDAYRQYFAYMKDVFERVLAAYHLDIEGKQDEVALLQYFLVRLLNSINCLGTKYSFEVDFKLKIDQSDSSYPNAYEFRTLKDDVKNRKENLETLRTRSVLLKDLVESIYAKRDELERIQHQLALRTYYENLRNEQSLFLPFTPGQLTELSQDNGRFRYLYTWGIFEDTLNVPMFFQMVFESHKGFQEPSQDVRFKLFLNDLEYASKYSLQLFEIATYLDRKCEDIYPKTLKRLTIGPLHGKYSTSDNLIAPFLNSFASPEVFALEVQSELLVSLDETTKSAETKPRQEFAIGKSSDASLRRISDCRQLLFLPHEVGQVLFSEKALKGEVSKYKVVTLKKTIK